MIALFLGLAAGTASAGPDVSARAPSGKSGEPRPEPSKDSEAKRKTNEGAKPASGARSGKDAVKGPHAGKHAPGHRGGQPDKTKVKAASHDKDTGGEPSPAAEPHQAESVDTPITAAPPPSTTTAAPLRNPDRDIRKLSSGAAGIATSLAGGGADPAVPVASAPAADAATAASSDPVGGALGPPLLGAGPAPSRWAPFVPALDEPTFPAILLAALAVFLALFGRGDRRDPKLVEAVVDDRAQDVDFS